MRISCVDFIKNCSLAEIEVKDHCLGELFFFSNLIPILNDY